MVSFTLPYAVAAVAAVALWAAALFALDVFTPSDVRAWRRLARLRGYSLPRSRVETMALRIPAVARLQREADVRRLLALAGRDASPLGFATRAAALGATACAGTLALDGAWRAATGDWILGAGPWLALAAGIVACLGAWARLERTARRRQTEAESAVGDMLMLVAIMTDGRGLQLDDAVRILSRCLRGDALASLLDRGGWRRLVPGSPRTTIELYRAVAEAYEIPMLSGVADAAANANVGLSERDAYARLAKSVYQTRIALQKMRAARAKILVTVPVAGMLIPLLIILGAPTMSSISSAFG